MTSETVLAPFLEKRHSRYEELAYGMKDVPLSPELQGERAALSVILFRVEQGLLHQEQGDGSPTWEQDLLTSLRKPLLPDVELTPKVVARERFLQKYAAELEHVWKQAGVLS